MSTNNNLIEINNLSYVELRLLMNKQPVKHLEEVPFGDFDLLLDLQHEVYTSSEELGYCKCYAAYYSSQYVGYMVVMASEMIHHRDIFQAVTDSFYIAPAYRSLGVFQELLAYVEQDLKANNIRFFTVGLNPNMPNFVRLRGVMNKTGYQHTECAITKEL